MKRFTSVALLVGLMLMAQVVCAGVQGKVQVQGPSAVRAGFHRSNSPMQVDCPDFSSLTPICDSVVVRGDTAYGYFGYLNSSPDTIFIFQDTAGSLAYTYNVMSGNILYFSDSFWNLGDPTPQKPGPLDGFVPTNGDTVSLNPAGQPYVVEFPVGSSVTWTCGTRSVTVMAKDPPMPIQLASFKVAVLASSGVILTWTTASEINNYGFYVQRDGQDISKLIPGNGTTLESHTYQYTDNAIGQHRYGLKQVDLDGTATLSETIMVDVAPATPTKFGLNQNYPNPFNPSTQIAFSVTKAGPISLKVYDIVGREVASLVNEARMPGSYTVRFDAGRLASGVYMYVLRSAEGQRVSRMLLQK